MALRNLVLEFQNCLHVVKKTRFTKKIPNKLYSFSILVPYVYCSNNLPRKIEIPPPEHLTPKYLLTQAGNVTANAASVVLNYTVSAISDLTNEYIKSLNEILSLIEECQNNIGNEQFCQDANDVLMEYRSTLESYKRQFSEMETLFTYVEKLTESAAETSFLLGEEFMSTTLGELLHNARQKVTSNRETILALEHEYLDAQTRLIESSSKDKKK